MRRYRLLTSFWLVFGLTACTRQQTDVQPADDGVQLLGVTIPGFPSENIRIDQVKKEIVLTVPDSPSDASFKITSFQTTAGSNVWQPATKWVSLCNGGGEPIYVLNETKGSAYKFVIKQSRPLAIGFIDNQTKATIGQPLAVRIDNMIDGNGDGTVVLTRTDTGEQDSLRVSCQAGSNQYMLETPQHIRPGEYTVSIQNKSGRRAVATSKLTFLKGAPEAGAGPMFVTAGTPVEVRGKNLFADDAPELLLRRSSGETIRVKPTSVSPYGWGLTMPLPASLKAGYYDMQVLVQGKAVSAMQRIAVCRDERQPAIGRINDELTTASETKPIVLVRGRVNSASIWPQLFSYTGSMVKLAVQLTAIDGLGQSSRFVFSDESYSYEYPPSLIVPATIQPGRYKMHVIATYNDGTVSESEPLERVVEVQ